MPTLTLEDRRKGIQTRFVELVERHSQAEIARKTGTSRTKVHRYVQGTRIPCEFAAALTDKLGVNPSWLLTGEGADTLGDVAPDTAQIASNLLDMIKAMSAVEHMQLGALTGKHHLRMLRELNDATIRYERLREQLNARSTPILRRLLDELRAALDKRDADQAEDLSRTAEQLRRLCDEPDLALEFAVLQRRLAIVEADPDETFALTRKVITLALHRGSDLGSVELEALAETTASLAYMGRLAEARRIAEAVLSLASPATRHSTGARLMTAELAMIRILSGDLRAGMELTSQFGGALPGLAGERADTILTRGLLLSGNIQVPTAITFKGDSSQKAEYILDFAVFLEDRDMLNQALKYWNSVHHSRRSGREWMLHRHARIVLAAVCGESAAAIEALNEHVGVARVKMELVLDWRSIVSAQVYRLVGAKTDARRCFRRASRRIAELPDWFSMGIMWQARHMRNALELGTRAQQKEAHEWFERHVELGYRCFADLVEQPSGAPK